MLADAQSPTTLAQARDAFRQSPSQSTALAYMDAAIAEWERSWIVKYVDDARLCDREPLDRSGERMHAACQEVRDWLMNVRAPTFEGAAR